jgi:ureidoacrylate peracid hydrolase
MSSMPSTLEEQLQPEHSALLVIDMQNDFCAEGGYLHTRRNYDVSFAPTVAANIRVLIDGARQAGVPVVWIHSIYDFKYLTESYRVKRGEEGCCLEGSWGAAPFGVEPAQGDIVVQKHSFSGFYGTGLNEALRAQGIKTLIITGVATNVCVDSTLREGFFHGYYIVLAEDCVGSNSRIGHEGTLATVRNNIGAVVPSQKVAALLSRRVSA